MESETKWALVVVLLIVAIATMSTVAIREAYATNRLAMEKGYIQVNDKATTCHWEKR